MKFNFLSVLILLSIVSCNSFKKVKVENVNRIFLDYDMTQPINYSSSFEAKVFLEMKTGEQVELPNEKGFTTSTNIDIRNSKDKLTIVGKPTSFNQEKLPITLSISDKNGMEVTSNDTIVLNFKAALSPNFNASFGTNGSNGTNGSGRDKRGDGNPGQHGVHGTNGNSAQSFDMWVWRVDSMYYFYVVNRNTTEIMRYQVFGNKKFIFSANGGEGGDGGHGGNGASGRDGAVSGNTSTQPGNGGNGGDGGNAGNGGSGGNITVYLHPSATDLQANIILNTYGGKAGNPGNAGNGGVGGKSQPGQGIARAGYNGRKGNFGSNGIKGAASIMVQEFDPTTKI